MATILVEGYLFFDGMKYILDPTIPEGPPGPEGPQGPAGSAGTLLSILQNRIQNNVTAAFTSVTGGGNIVAPVTLTMIASGKVRITANVGYQTNGFTTPLIWLSVNGGTLTNVFTCQQQAGNNTTAANSQVSIVFGINTSATPGQTVEAFFQTTAGDHSISIFTNGVGDAAASLALEELP